MGKKKKKTGARIGYIFALAVVFGTVVFSSMVNPGAASKTKSLIGDSTGSFVTAYTSNKGFDKTKKLLSDTFGNWFPDESEGKTKDAEYKSFSMSFHIATEAGRGVEYTTVDGAVYSDKDYTYMKVNKTMFEGGRSKTEFVEYFYCKDTKASHQTQPISYIPNPMDSFLNDKKDWEVIEDDNLLEEVQNSIVEHIAVDNYFKSKEDWEFDLITGQFEYDGIAVGNASFTVGWNPRLMFTGVKGYNAKTGMDEIRTLTCRYSNLNNTVVVVPAGVEKLMQQGGNN